MRLAVATLQHGGPVEPVGIEAIAVQRDGQLLDALWRL